MEVSLNSAPSGAPNLDHDHSKGKNISFLAVCTLLLQDLWCSPPRAMTVLTRGGPHGVQVLSNRGEAEIGDACATGIIHEDVWLAKRQHDGEARLIKTTHSFEVPMNHIAGVEVFETLSDVG